MVSELLEEPFNEVSPFAAGANVGYLSPASKYQPFIFVTGEPHEATAEALVNAIRDHGLPFIRSNIPLLSLLETMRSTRYAIQFIAVYRIPVAMHLLGHEAEADAFLDRQLAKLGAASDPAATRFRHFAARFRDRDKSTLSV